MLIVGLTGGIASGKSTVSTRLREKHKFTIVDADLIAREVVYPGKKAYKQILTEFNDVPNLVNEDGSLNRAVLGESVFGNKTRLTQLNRIVHPAVRYEIFRQILMAYVSFKQLVILDVPLLFEAGLDKICGLTVTVSSSPSLQLERLLKRNPELSPEDAQMRIDSQMPSEEKNYRADLVIDNCHDLQTLYDSIDSIAQEIKPNKIFTLLDYFPPFALVSAILTFSIRLTRDKFKGTKPKQN